MPPVNYPTPSQIFQQYSTTLKGLRPDLNVLAKSGEALIRGRTVAGIISGVYADQRKIDDDTFLKDARIEALLRHGEDEGIARQPATAAETVGFLASGTPGTAIPALATLRYPPTGILYSVQTATVVGGGGTVLLSLLANTTGQITNVLAGETLEFVSPITGVNPTGTLSIALADGADIESEDSYRSRLLLNRQRRPAGGNQYDYPRFAFEADPSVRSALIRRFGRGLGTVDVYITTGTTDIDTAVTNGNAIVRVPSPTLIQTVQDYYEAHVPLTDCPRVYGPTETPQDATVFIALADGILLTTVPADAVYNPLNLTVEALIKREISRVLYKVPVGGRLVEGLPGGYVLASEIEQQLDVMLSATPGNNGIAKGLIPVLIDRECDKLAPPDYNRLLTGAQLSTPGTLTVIEGV